MAKFKAHKERTRPTTTSNYVSEGATWHITTYDDLPTASGMFMKSGYLPDRLIAFHQSLAENDRNGQIVRNEEDRAELKEVSYFYSFLAIKSVRYEDEGIEYRIVNDPTNEEEREAISAKEDSKGDNWMFLSDIPYELILIIYQRVIGKEVTEAEDFSAFPEERTLAA